jgi:hypothetical protein
VRIGVLNLGAQVEPGQNLRAHLNMETFCPLDLLARCLDVGISLQRGQDCLR